MGGTLGIIFNPDGLYLYGAIGYGHGVSVQATTGTSMTDSILSFSFQGTVNLVPGNLGPYNAGSVSIDVFDIPKLINKEFTFYDLSWEAGRGVSVDAAAYSFEVGITAPLFKY